MKFLNTLLLLSLVTSSVFAIEPINHAPQATITADSEYNIHFKAQFVADGVIPEIFKRNGDDKEWAVQGTTHKNGSTLTMKWVKPIEVSELVYYGRSAFAIEGWKDYEIYLDNQNQPVKR